jgi:hypothetical protein
MSSYLPTLYKARNFPTKQVACCICVERTRGRTQKLVLGYGVEIWLCKDHASREFQTQRNGRDFELTLMRLWQAHGCWTLARQKALKAFAAARDELKQPRHKPGSYAWPDLRLRAEQAFAEGATPDSLTRRIHRTYHDCPARPPSHRTLQRWHAERRWLQRPPPQLVARR